MKKLRRRSKIASSALGQAGLLAFATVAILWSPEKITAMAPIPFAAYTIWRLFENPYLAMDDRGVYVNNWYIKYFIPYSLISACDSSPTLTLSIHGGEKVRIAAFDATIFFKREKRTLEREINRRASSAQSSSSREKIEKRYTFGLPEILGPGISLIFFVLCQ